MVKRIRVAGYTVKGHLRRVNPSGAAANPRQRRLPKRNRLGRFVKS